MVNDLHDELNKPRSRSRPTIMEPKSAQEAWSIYRNRYDDSKLIDIFVGQYASVIKCSYCGNESTCWDPFWDLPLPVPRNRNRIDIDECIAEFTSAEILDGNEQPVCNNFNSFILGSFIVTFSLTFVSSFVPVVNNIADQPNVFR